jgi:hypothetical protein
MPRIEEALNRILRPWPANRGSRVAPDPHCRLGRGGSLVSLDQIRAERSR